MNSDLETPPPPLPDAIITDILYRLPVKTLLRFRCVSKQLRSIIDDPDFVNLHLQYQSSNRQKLIFECKPPEPNLFFLDLDVIENVFKVEPPFENSRVRLLGSCDGLLAVSFRARGSSGVYLWNVSTRKHKVLPPSGIFKRFEPCGGFGRDPSTDDYKLVSLQNSRNNFCVSKAAVYSLKSNSWRRIESVPSEFYLTQVAAHVGGNLYWWGNSIEHFSTRLIGFDLKEERFFEVPYVSTYNETMVFVQKKLVDLGGRLGVFRVYRDEFCVYEVSVLDRNGSEYSWTKLYSMLHDEVPLRSLGHDPMFEAFVHSKHGDTIFIFEDEEQLVVQYDFKEKKMETFKINKFPEKLGRDTSSYVTYVESLVSPGVNE